MNVQSGTAINGLGDILARAERAGGWSRKRGEQVCADYLAFLSGAALQQDLVPPPSRDVDLLWHVHMLHPVHYARFCHATFGVVVDHRLSDSVAPVDGDAVTALAAKGCNKPQRPGTEPTGMLVALATMGCNGPA